MTTARVTVEHQPGLHVAVTDRGTLQEWFVLAYPIPDESDPLAVFSRAAGALHDRDAHITNQFVWHRAELADSARQTWEKLLGPTSWPVSWMIDPLGVHPYGGTTIRAISGRPVDYIHEHGRTIGARYSSDYADYFLLGDLRDLNTSRPAPAQTKRVLLTMRNALAQAGMNFTDVMRTWFFNDDILGWYGAFNEVRTAFFHEWDVFNHTVPASTGIGTRNLGGAALISSLIAARGKNPEEFSFYAVPSPLQNPAEEYASSFSRAVEIATPDRRHLFISGTASIDKDGKTIHLGDAHAQTHFTLDVIEALLDSRGMNWSDSLQGVAYIRDEKDTQTVLRCFQQRGLAQLPVLFSNNTVCRDDLLFELEIQAARRPL